MQRHFDTLIVGAGLAGLSTAWHLARKGIGPLAIVEASPEAGSAASAQNASMICRLEEDAVTTAVLAEGARILEREWPAQIGCEPVRPTGSLYVTDGCADSDRLEAMSLGGAQVGVTSDLLTRDETLRLFPFLKDSAFDAALYCNADGVANVKNLVAALAAAVVAKGVTLSLSAPVTLRRAGELFQAQTPEGIFTAARVVNAAGAWAGEIAHQCGAQGFAVTPLKRHIFITAPMKGLSPEWPIVWDVSRGVYFRTEGSGLMISPCDEEPAVPGPAPTNPAAEQLTREKISFLYPPAKSAPFETGWAGLRTFSPDRRFVIGPDARIPGFFWIACLGGHGVTASAAAGKLAAAFVTGSPVNPSLVRALSPARFA